MLAAPVYVLQTVQKPSASTGELSNIYLKNKFYLDPGSGSSFD